MTEKTRNDKTTDPAAAAKRLEELREERARLSARQLELQKKVVAGRSATEVDALAGRLIAGESADAVVEDYTTLARAVADQIAIVDKAAAMLADVVKLHEYRRQQIAAVPKFRRASAHIKRLSAALLAVEAVLLEAQADLVSFDDASGGGPNVYGDDRYAAEPRLFDPQQLIPLRQWPSTDFIEAYGTSRFRRWHAEAQSLGAL